jgi:hypothetical protein
MPQASQPGARDRKGREAEGGKVRSSDGGSPHLHGHSSKRSWRCRHMRARQHNWLGQAADGPRSPGACSLGWTRRSHQRPCSQHRALAPPTDRARGVGISSAVEAPGLHRRRQAPACALTQAASAHARAGSRHLSLVHPALQQVDPLVASFELELELIALLPQRVLGGRARVQLQRGRRSHRQPGGG